MKKEITLPTLDKVDFAIILHEESIPVRGNAIASGDGEYDKRVEDRIIRRLKNGDLWAWCCVEVKGTYRGLQYSDYLGGCSYLNEKGFKVGGYYEDMCDTCYRGILEQLEALAL